MIILRPLLLLTNLHLKLLSTQGTGVDKLLSTQRVKKVTFFYDSKNTNMAGPPSSQSELSYEHTYPITCRSRETTALAVLTRCRSKI